MRVRIICCEDVDEWILGKFARRLCENLKLLQVDADIGRVSDPAATVNHYIIYAAYDGRKNNIDTVMITHIDTEQKIKFLQRTMRKVDAGICGSLATLRQLAREGMPRAKLCYVNPAHDSVMKPRRLVVGIASRVYPTGCKREYLVAQLAERISPDDFKFWIMGAGWDGIVAGMRFRGIAVDYHDHFEYEAYHAMIPHLDYYLYTGQDEGSMGFLDAVSAGVPTIVTPQGFHLDAVGGITYAFNDIEELERIFDEIAGRRKQFADAVSSWTWSEYARRHLLVWQYLRQQKGGVRLPQDLIRDLGSLGVTQRGNIAALETLFYRAARKIRRGVQEAGRLVRHRGEAKC